MTTSLCSPSRGSFLTGQYAHLHGVRNNAEDPAEMRNLAADPAARGQLDRMRKELFRLLKATLAA